MTKLRATLAAAALLLASGVAGAALRVGSGVPATQERAAAGFNGIALALPARLEVVQGASEDVTVTADDNLVGEIEAVVERGILHLRLRDGVEARFKAAPRVVVRAQRVDSLAVQGAGQLFAERLKSESLAVSIQGSGVVRLGGVEAGELAAALRGSGDLQAAGSVDTVRVHIAGSGQVGAGRLQARRASVSIAGSGDAEVRAGESLEVRISGSGDVRYHGEPRIERRIAGSGSVRRAKASPA